MTKTVFLIVIISLGFLISFDCLSQGKELTLSIKFNHVANGVPLLLGDTNHINAFSEPYTITRLKYYISNVTLQAKDRFVSSKEIFLQDASAEESINIGIVSGEYTALSFTVGIDSILNCSGAQEASLDPLKGMFWTWNSGYVFFKLEGYSTASTADLHRIEHHIGGYKAGNNASRKVELLFNKPLHIPTGKGATTVIEVKMNLDKYWHGKNDIFIASTPLVLVPGDLSKKSADNFLGIFSIIEPN
jgi:hypothetical protein